MGATAKSTNYQIFGTRFIIFVATNQASESIQREDHSSACPARPPRVVLQAELIVVKLAVHHGGQGPVLLGASPLFEVVHPADGHRQHQHHTEGHHHRHHYRHEGHGRVAVRLEPHHQGLYVGPMTPVRHVAKYNP